MLVLKRKEGQWIEIQHKSGDRLRIRVYNIRPRFPGQLDLAIEDDALNFEVQRPERGRRGSARGVRSESSRRRLEPEPPPECADRDAGVKQKSVPLRPLAHCQSRRALDSRGRDESS
jgi:hypothetical protein